MNGAFATEQGNCSLFKFDIPHSCEERPVILDLMPEASLGNRSEGCCRSGVLSAWAVDRSKSFSSFEISVGSKDEDGNELPPANITLMAPGPGYTCSPFLDSHPTVSSVIDGKREVQVFSKYFKCQCNATENVAFSFGYCLNAKRMARSRKFTNQSLCSLWDQQSQTYIQIIDSTPHVHTCIPNINSSSCNLKHINSISNSMK